MNKITLKIVMLLLSVFILSSCQKTVSYPYLMQHPDVLQKEYVRCQSAALSHCDDVMHAVQDFSFLIRQRNEDPEWIGWQIMQAQQRGDEQRVHILYAVVKASS